MPAHACGSSLGPTKIGPKGREPLQTKCLGHDREPNVCAAVTGGLHSSNCQPDVCSAATSGLHSSICQPNVRDTATGGLHSSSCQPPHSAHRHVKGNCAHGVERPAGKARVGVPDERALWRYGRRDGDLQPDRGCRVLRGSAQDGLLYARPGGGCGVLPARKGDTAERRRSAEHAVDRGALIYSGRSGSAGAHRRSSQRSR
mmetsp:Transcript_9294/g.28336  ORF Transcript_9294/g.28336 Transcript_9294/m.28336 type:complete len:201 (+) Transcript_9294:533-1135(+)